MDNTVCGYTNWDTFIVTLTADNNECLYNELWAILKNHGDDPKEAKTLLLNFYQGPAYRTAQADNGGEVAFDAVNWEELVTDALQEWQDEKQHYQEPKV